MFDLMERHCSSAAEIGEIARILRPTAIMLAAHNRSATSCETPRNPDAKDLRPAHWELGIRFFRLSFDPASNAG